MSITKLPSAPGAMEPRPFADESHPMRKVTRQVAFDGAWDAERAAKVTALFDSMAADWTADHDGPERLASLDDALERGQVPAGPVLEVGSGTGLGTRNMAARGVGPIVALDLAGDMLRHAPPQYGARLRGDASVLPIAAGTVAAMVHVNALLFPGEVDRVLAAEGVVVWVNTNGEQTPIHLPVADVAAALPGQWTGVESRAGTGTWGVLRRAG